jgi:putative ABC transport system ATP-binding protein
MTTVADRHDAQVMTDPLVIDNLVRRYSAEVTALAGISLSFAAGSSAAIVGPSGSGKSTLLGLIAGLDRPDGGRVLIEGRDLATLGERERSRLRAQRLGFVFQSYRLLPTLTALENVALAVELAGLDQADERARTWLERVGLGDRAGHLPTRLSGGEQQRVAVARALVAGPALVLADEPTGNLDSRTGAAIADLLLGLAGTGGATLILVTHDESLARRTGRIVRLADGQVVADGAP